MLKEKWWKGGKCQDEAASGGADDAAELGIANVGGVFLVLGVGCFVALIVAIIEFLWNVNKIAIEARLALWEAFKTEFLFAINFSIVTKPVHNAVSESPKSASARSRARSICFDDPRMSELSVNLHNGCNHGENNNNGDGAGAIGPGKFSKLASRSLSGINRIGNLFAKKTSD